MNQNVNKKYYFMIIKCIYMLLLWIFFIVYIEDAISIIGWQFLIFSILFMLTIVYELLANYKMIVILLKLLISSILIYRFHINYVFLLPVVILDGISYLQLPMYMYFLPSIFTFLLPKNQEVYLLFSSLTSVIYYQNHIILSEYQATVDLQEEKEYLLKNRMKQEAEKKQHDFENQLLLDRESIYQRLHDRLGHAINGSIYQMEASKILVDSDSEKSKEILQNVINTLRISMDDIRQMLRKERPSKQQLALLQLRQLCEECKVTYGIKASLEIEVEDIEIPEWVWEIILDNSLEAVSNALKYAKCQSIEIKVRILPQIVQCWIRDDGIGCIEVVEGMGLQGMKQRVRKVNGTLHIKSEIGFEIHMMLPFHNKES